MTTNGNFKIFLNGKEVTEQEIRDCKEESMSVSVDNLCCFYSFSPKIGKVEASKINKTFDKVYDNLPNFLKGEDLSKTFVIIKTNSEQEEKLEEVRKLINSNKFKQDCDRVKEDINEFCKNEKIPFRYEIDSAEKDKTEYLDIYKNLVDMRKTYKENQTNYHQVVTDKEQPIEDITTLSYNQYPADTTGDICWKTHQLKHTNFPQKEIKTEGIKHNKGKLPLDTMITKQFPNALEAVCKATLFGHEYYKEFDADWLNYQRVEGGSQAYAEAMLRHNMDKAGLDDKSGLPHIYHVVWNAMAMLELWLKEN